MGVVFFYDSNIPKEYKEHEFTEFYKQDFSPKYYNPKTEIEIIEIMGEQFSNLILVLRKSKLKLY